jgi:hypothetical protein
MARGKIVIHNAGGRFQIQGQGPTVQPQKLTAGEIVQLLRKRPGSS